MAYICHSLDTGFFFMRENSFILVLLFGILSQVAQAQDSFLDLDKIKRENESYKKKLYIAKKALQ